MTNTKITQVEALEMAIETMEKMKKSPEAIEVLKKMILTKQGQAQKAKERRAKKQEANKGLIEEIATLLKREKGATIDEIKEVDTFKDFSTQKISALITKLKETEDITITIDGKKKRYMIK